MRGGERRCGRHGLLAALEGRAGIVGYDGADLASPPGEMARLVDLLRARRRRAVTCSGGYFDNELTGAVATGELR